jgi:uncharacterized tellurite resistance protein B-like protein
MTKGIARLYPEDRADVGSALESRAIVAHARCAIASLRVSVGAMTERCAARMRLVSAARRRLSFVLLQRAMRVTRITKETDAMAIVVRKIKKPAAKPKAADVSVDETKALVGSVVMLAYCALLADGEVEEAEVDALRGIIRSGFASMLGVTVSDEDIDGVIERAGEAFDELGYEGMMRSAAEVVSQSEARKDIALTFTAYVIMSDGDFDLEGSEAEYYDDLAELLGVDEERAAEIWNETMASFEE